MFWYGLQAVLQSGYVLYKSDKGSAQYTVPEGTEVEVYRKVRMLCTYIRPSTICCSRWASVFT